MAKYMVLSTREWEKVLRLNGFRFLEQKGSHRMYVRDNIKIPVTKHEVNPMVMRRMIKEYNLEI